MPLLATLMPADAEKLDRDARDYMPQDIFPSFRHRDFETFWTGWKPAQYSMMIFGQWVAYRTETGPVGKYGCYVSVPNMYTQWFAHPGWIFNLDFVDASVEDDAYKMMGTKEGRLTLIERGRAKLVEMLDNEPVAPWEASE